MSFRFAAVVELLRALQGRVDAWARPEMQVGPWLLVEEESQFSSESTGIWGFIFGENREAFDWVMIVFALYYGFVFFFHPRAFQGNLSLKMSMMRR